MVRLEKNGSSGGSVISVFGRVGAVVAQAGDYDVTLITNAQELLVSGTNIKTINGASILGGGNMVVTGAPPTLTTVEVDFGIVPVSSKSFTIADAAVDVTKKILTYTDSAPATARIGNDWEFDMPFMSAVAGAGNFVLSFVFNHLIVGKRNIMYQII